MDAIYKVEEYDRRDGNKTGIITSYAYISNSNSLPTPDVSDGAAVGNFSWGKLDLVAMSLVHIKCLVILLMRI